MEIAKSQAGMAQKLSEVEEKAILEKARLAAEAAKALLDDEAKRDRSR